uniref:NAD-dependent epimerase/dehydratase domain-containing protein n=1 Tax=Aegilops tauschii subsp. strangulata TaxID=200361 RepID=A0A453JLR6_AEGTS
MAAASVSLKSSLFLSSPLSDFGGAAISISAQNRRRSWQPRGARMQVAAAADSKNILIMGGTRFIGLFLSRKLVQEGHQVTLFTRGKAPITQQLPGESDAEYAEFSSKVCCI